MDMDNENVERDAEEQAQEFDPAEWEDISGDGGILKKILREGEGDDNPLDGYEVRVHYVGKLLDGTQFDSSRDRNEIFKFKIGTGSVIKGWDEGVATMKRGELAILRCEPDYAYGERGSPPKIPPGATLEFEVELFDWDEFDEIASGVWKKELVAGSGYKKPKDGAGVTLKYKPIVEGADENKEQDIAFVIGETEDYSEAFEEAVKSMKKGEKSLFRIEEKTEGWEQGDYEIECLDFQEVKERWQMDGPEKVDAAISYKERGNDFFKSGSLRLARRKYEAAIDLLKYESKLEGDLKERADELKVSCNNNLAAVAFKEGKYRDAIKFANDALEISEGNTKAILRRANAYLSIGDVDEAARDVQTVLQTDAENKSALKLKKKIKIARKKEQKREQAVFGGIFK